MKRKSLYFHKTLQFADHLTRRMVFVKHFLQPIPVQFAKALCGRLSAVALPSGLFSVAPSG